MRPARREPVPARERGFSLLELMVALIVLSIGVLAVARLFPAGTHGQTQDKLQSTANYLAQEELERLGALAFDDAQLSIGRHPAGSATQACGPNDRWSRWYEVAAVPPPLDDLKKVTLHVTWNNAGGRSIVLSTYVRP
ncbi:MAG: prepilin-type N-terminal cleavage/methylation domain-containing protein [Candidatus Eisenbacteria bacterium]|uniref:Prepilin-type N-terminal cleavage/methylation domain-containing protein n=1 Tax=Eiseniibacteriota bacterium TaxID=2212470 RepID=A0A933W3L5_UNCEI|nr:prepilin-type N-terminal cleavage/methylation domain-containing protein [Candidatus Eisenbacteria bacterium]